MKFDKFCEQITIKDKDYFNWQNPKIPTKKTILNDQKACLRRCEDLLKKMRMKGESVFTDPDFGPQDKDDLAQDSLYFEDIPSGYP